MTEIEEVKSERKGSRHRLTNLRNRSASLVRYVEKRILPNLYGLQKKQCRDKLDEVKRVIPRRYWDDE